MGHFEPTARWSWTNGQIYRRDGSRWSSSRRRHAQPRRGLANVIDEILRGRLARGEPGRSADDIDAGLREGEDEYEKKMQELVANGRTPPAVGS